MKKLIIVLLALLFVSGCGFFDPPVYDPNDPFGPNGPFGPVPPVHKTTNTVVTGK